MIFFMPLMLVRGHQGIDHPVPMLLMGGIAAGFVHGVGFLPGRRIWR